ncbi:PadR family transcriptional regulator [Ornithinimicrobium avium]|uniref:PadR family transcriptional regulator n=1 Tax=Ornithinimicrobium avium TaxID=2283195 RepID=A0A345NP89_9MICO|nr:PadR family transcriptional regulator [Ornithinimicrobium avium]AXH96847.1 PadR family transcriptional regulator [Ornithinimicrobium avium]
MTDTSGWPAPWVRAALELAILGSLRTGPLHGYALAQSLQERGFGLLRGGSLYPMLGRLEADGHVRAAWVEGAGGPGRKDYTLTAGGRTHLTEGLAAWRGLTDELTKGGE